jgi:hypothetical protein
MKRLLIVCAVAAASACSPAGAPEGAGFAARSSGGANVQTDGNTIRVTRSGSDGNQGVTITQAPVAVTFTVEGEGARIRARQGGGWVAITPGEETTVVLGRGGARAVRIDSANAPELVVRVTRVTDCATQAEVCTQQSAAIEEEDAADETPAETPAAAPADPAAADPAAAEPDLRN